MKSRLVRLFSVIRALLICRLRAGPKKQRPKGNDPGALTMWMMGSNRKKTLKAEKKPEVLQNSSSRRAV